MISSSFLATLRSRLKCSCSAFTAKQSPPNILFPFFITLNLLLYTDRGIIPGASREFSVFATSASDSPNFIKSSPDAGLGILQASFIGGYSFAIVICGHLVHVVPWKKMTTVGFVIWISSVLLSGFSYMFDSFTILMIGRILSGVAEASFHVIAPPMFQDRGGKNAALWLSIYLCAMPLGMALGYVFGSEVANSPKMGWYWAFIIEGLVALPILFFQLLFIRDDKNGGVFAPYETSSVDARKDVEITDAAADVVGDISAEKEKSDDITNDNNDVNTHPTFMDEIRICLESRILIYIIIAQSVCIAVVSVMSTFGGAFLLALQLFDKEQAGARSFGITAALAGVIGTPLGGLVMDKVLSRNKRRKMKDTLTNMEQLVHVLPVITIFVTVGITICYPTLFFTTAFPFLAFLFFGWAVLFMSQAGITYCIMLSVPESNRSNAIAFSTLMSHVLGDVPAPILFGFLKDKLAPACNITANGAFVDDVRCEEQHLGIRGTIAIAYAWITLSIVFFELARRVAKREYAQQKIDTAGEGGDINNKDENGVELKSVSVESSDIRVEHLDDGDVENAQYC